MRPRRSTEAESKKKGVSKAGTTLVEFSLIALLFFMLIFGIVEFGRLLLMYHYVGHSAREGSRYAIVHGSTSLSPANDADVENYVKSISPFDPKDVDVDTTWPDGNNNPKSKVNVKVDYPFAFILPIWFGPSITLSSTSQMVISY